MNVSFCVQKPGEVDLSVYDPLGRKMENVYQGKLHKGSYHVFFNARDYASGVYYMQLSCADHSWKKPVTLLK